MKLSNLFQPLKVIPRNAKTSTDMTSKSQKLMLETGLIRPASNGMYTILPLLQRSIEKLTTLLDRTMRDVGAQKITLPTLTTTELWKKSGRLSTAPTELLFVKDRHGKEFILSPTHEEAITSMLSSISPLSYRNLPLRMYQITSKFRDEPMPKLGLLRTKEFLMKDLYTFDRSLKDAKITYDTINEGYKEFFRKIGIPTIKVAADTGIMGGTISHEYHILADVGEDSILKCSICSFLGNEETFTGCSKCDGKNIVKEKGIEVAHAFILDDKYTKPLGATFLQGNGKSTAMIMGCYGIGVTRLIAAALECLSTNTELRWPLSIAPFKVCLIPPKSGSKEETKLSEFIPKFLAHLETVCHDYIIDDRSLTIGKRVMEAKKTGYPFIIVIGEKAVHGDPKIECHDSNNDVVNFMGVAEIFKFLQEKQLLNS